MTSVQPTTGLKRKHVTLTIGSKLKVLEKLESGRMSGREISEEFGISRQTVSDIKRQRNTIIAFAQNYDVTNDRISGRKTLKRPKDDILETALYKWYTRQQATGAVIDSSDLRQASEQLKQQLGLHGITCSPAWFRRFKYRHCIPSTTKVNCDASHEDAESEYKDTHDHDVEVVVKTEPDGEDVLVAEPVMSFSADEEDQPPKMTSAEYAALKAAREGIDAVINYVGYSSNRQLWKHYEQLRVVKEIIVMEHRKMMAETAPKDFYKTEVETSFTSSMD